MQKLMLLAVIPFLACATAKEAAPAKTVTVEKPIIVEVAPLTLRDCDKVVESFTTDDLQTQARKACEEINAKENLRYRADKAEAEAKVLKAQAAARAEEKPRRRGSGGGPVMMAGAHPGGSVDEYNTTAAFMDPAGATKCGGPSARSLTILDIAEGDITGRANRVVVYVPSRGQFVSVQGCFFTPPQATILTDLDGNTRFDAPYGAGNLIGDLHIPADEAILYYLDCDGASVCEVATVKRFHRHGGRSWVSARGGNVLKYVKNRS